MAQRSKVRQLPAAVREWLDGTLAEKNFSGYEEIAAELAKRGYTLGKSSIHRYGSNLEKRLSAIKASTEAARLIAATAPDDADDRSSAVISMIQTEMFEVLVGMQEAEKADDPVQRAKILSAVAKNMATLSRASVNLKRHAIEIRARTEAAADKVAKLAKKGGMSSATVDSIKREILGISGP